MLDFSEADVGAAQAPGGCEVTGCWRSQGSGLHCCQPGLYLLTAHVVQEHTLKDLLKHHVHICVIS